MCFHSLPNRLWGAGKHAEIITSHHHMQLCACARKRETLRLAFGVSFGRNSLCSAYHGSAVYSESGTSDCAMVRVPDTCAGATWRPFLICPSWEPGAVRVLSGGDDLRDGARFWWLWARIRQPARSGWGFVRFDLWTPRTATTQHLLVVRSGNL